MASRHVPNFVTAAQMRSYSAEIHEQFFSNVFVNINHSKDDIGCEALQDSKRRSRLLHHVCHKPGYHLSINSIFLRFQFPEIMSLNAEILFVLSIFLVNLAQLPSSVCQTCLGMWYHLSLTLTRTLYVGFA